MSLFAPPTIGESPIQPRPYQIEALEALDLHMRTRDTHPCVVIPTGGGKSILMAWAIANWKRDYPPFRCCVLAHRKELVEQNAAEMRVIWSGGDIGVYSAGLGKRDRDASVLFASIDSVHARWGEFAPFDVLIIDEAHRIPARGEGKYRAFITGCRKVNKALRVVGFTATPFRMGCGPICHRDHILNEICYEANVGDLIAQGYLSRLRSKVGDVQADLSAVERNRGGDYKEASLAGAVDTPDIVQRAVRSAMMAITAEKRASVVFFCLSVEHCQHVSMELRKYGIEAPVVTAQTPAADRDRICEAFKAGRYRALCNVNVYTEGFNAKRVDCVVLLRPTLSPGLYVQMVGRGLRLHPGKADCLVLDYARCIETHGPIDCLGAGSVTLIDCGQCGDTFSRAIRTCPHCGWTIPPQEVERAEAAERERQQHEAEAAQRAILGNQPEVLKVDDVTVHLHRKPGSPDSLRVQYRCGLSVIPEWVCLDHPGFAGQKARAWWASRFGRAAADAITVSEAASDLFLPQQLKSITETITVTRRGKYHDIVAHGFATQERVHEFA